MPKAPKAVGKPNKLVHPNSRHAMVIQRQTNRENRVMKVKAEATLKQELVLQKYLWFQKNMDSQKTTYTKHELAELVSQYLDRFNEELEQIGIVNAVGNRQPTQHQAREAAIKITQEKENHEFDTVGIEVPDLVNGKNAEYFKNWTGEIRYFPNIKLRRSKRTDMKHENETSQPEKSSIADNGVETNNDELPDYDETA